jgi:hypothetical protein
MSYDAVRARVVLAVGGQLLEWDGSDWRRVATTSIYAPELTHDTLRGECYLFDGERVLASTGAAPVPMLRLPTPSPPPSRTFAAVYHAATDRVVLCGGAAVPGASLPTLHSFAETWLYEPGEPALARPFGSGCAGSSGTPVLAARSGTLPRPGETLWIDIAGLPADRLEVPFLVLGFSRDVDGALPLPADLTAIGMPDCSLLVAHAYDQALANEFGSASWSLALPNHAMLLRRRFQVQCLAVALHANALGVITSNAVEARIGLIAPLE